MGLDKVYEGWNDWIFFYSEVWCKFFLYLLVHRKITVRYSAAVALVCVYHNSLFAGMLLSVSFCGELPVCVCVCRCVCVHACVRLRGFMHVCTHRAHLAALALMHSLAACIQLSDLLFLPSFTSYINKIDLLYVPTPFTSALISAVMLWCVALITWARVLHHGSPVTWSSNPRPNKPPRIRNVKSLS